MRWSSLLGAVLLLVLGPAHGASSATKTLLVHKKKYAMGIVFDLVVYDSSADHALAGIDKAFQEIVRLDELLSNYKSDSELSRLNRSPHFLPQTVSPDLYLILEQSLAYSKISGGRFDITVAPLVDLWKAALRSGTQPSAREQSDAQRCIGYDKVELLPPNKVEFHSACLRIDLGAIGKGYALDRAAEILRSAGISRALLDAGGSTILTMGAPPGRPGWLIEMRDPSNRCHPQAILSDNSLSTSEQSPAGLLENSYAGHIIDPATGRPLRSALAVSVIAKTATASDALSTTLLLVGPRVGKSIVETGVGASAIWVEPTGEATLACSGPEITVRHGLASRCRVSIDRSAGAE
ncbi:MAG: FAD:protein FMN transferase [Acidobacteria bacterium]|nr:FAD:protein FMN transferase [Acidobacteriota bacterium]